MDFVDWSDSVLKVVSRLSEGASRIRGVGANSLDITRAIFGDDLIAAKSFWSSPRWLAVRDALEQLARVGLLEGRGLPINDQRYTLTSLGRKYAGDTAPYWEQLCESPSETELGKDHLQLLDLVNKLSPQDSVDHSFLQRVDEPTILQHLNWTAGSALLRPVAQELERYCLVQCSNVVESQLGIHQVKATYGGLVWQTRCGLTAESRNIDAMVARWETLSVEFKREVHTNTADENAELVKDLIALANTQTEDRRYLIIGFDDKTRMYHGPPDAKLSQNHLEQLVAMHIRPYLDLLYDVVPWRKGRMVGKLEVKRDPVKLPYCVAKAVGSKKKRVEEGQIFVRYGSQVREPTPSVLADLVREGDVARAGPRT